LTGLFTSNSAEIEWCAAAGTAIASAAAANKAQTVRFILFLQTIVRHEPDTT
jgi:hypothetical protein